MLAIPALHKDFRWAYPTRGDRSPRTPFARPFFAGDGRLLCRVSHFIPINRMKNAPILCIQDGIFQFISSPVRLSGSRGTMAAWRHRASDRGAPANIRRNIRTASRGRSLRVWQVRSGNPHRCRGRAAHAGGPSCSAFGDRPTPFFVCGLQVQPTPASLPGKQFQPTPAIHQRGDRLRQRAHQKS